MLKTVEHLNLIMMLNKYGLDLGLLKDFSQDILLRFCGNLEARKTPQPWYMGFPDIQKELLNDERFFFYLKKLRATNLSMTLIGSFLQVLHSNGETALDYPVGCLISSMAMSVNSSDVFYDYLKNFGSLSTNKEQKKIIIKNLGLYRKSLSKSIAELSDAEKLLFMEPILTDTKLIPAETGRAFNLLTRHPGLLGVIRFFYKNCLKVDLSIDNYKSFSIDPLVIHDKLKKLHKLLGNNNMVLMMKRWLENNGPIYDLDVLIKKLRNLDNEQLEDILNSRSGYINLIYGSKINNIQLSEIPKYKEDVLIYAITNKKYRFIRLVEENYKTFTILERQSILFKREFYAKYVNLNSLNAKNLLDCVRMDATKMLFNSLEPDRTYTFEEIKALYNLPKQYFTLYASLQIPRVDNRLIVLKQLSKQKLLAGVTDDEHISRLANVLSQKPLSVWHEQFSSHIASLKPQDSVGLLIHETEIKNLIPQMKTRIDARLVIRNWNAAQNYSTISKMKRELIKIDEAWGELIKKMGFTEEFLHHNQDYVIEFLCQNGAEIAMRYYDGIDDKQRESMKCIVKSVLMDQFSTLKYYADDLCKEIDYPITGVQKLAWMENTKSSSNEMLVMECDDFYSTMQLGIIPQRTCLSYIDGQYKECLLSGFDSNKKVLYAYIDGKIVGRAIIRLTKGKFSNGKNPKTAETLSFVDLEVRETPTTEKENKADKERLVIFLERSYSAGISDETDGIIRDMYVDLMVKKARLMGAMLVISNSYNKISRTDFTRTLFHIYISKSKAGSQYLDSLDGSADVSDEGGYKVNNFYISSDDII